MITSVPATAVVGLIVLSAGGLMPALTLARVRLVTIPLAPLTGALLASLSVTAVTGTGGTLLQWYVALSASTAAISALVWWRFPSARPWAGVRDAGTRPGRTAAVIAFAASAGACAFGLSDLGDPNVSYDGRAIWMLHPLWYQAGHGASVAALRNAALVFSHPQYPPLVGGTVALTWTISGLSAVRSGVVMIAILNVFAILAASTGVMELARQLARQTARIPQPGSATDGRFRHGPVLGVGAAVSVLLVLISFRGAGFAAFDGHADLLWAATAVGSVTYGLVLPWTRAHLGTALLLAAVAGTTKSEGALTAVSIILLVGVRGTLVARTGKLRRGYVQPVVFAFVSLVVVGLWPLVVRLQHALPNVEFSGVRDGNDGGRFVDTIKSASPHLEVLLVAVPMALVGAVFLRTRRRALGVGSDLWAWSVLTIAAAIIAAVYATGPGPIRSWLDTSIQRTTLYPLLAAWWIVGVWVVIAMGQVFDVRGSAVTQPLATGTSNWASLSAGASKQGEQSQSDWPAPSAARPAVEQVVIPSS